MKLSIGKAWDETKAIVARDGNALVTIALALLVLPGTIMETVAPSSVQRTEPGLVITLLNLAALLFSLAGQIAISRIALGPSTVGEALGTAFRRMPALFGALIVLVIPFVLLASLLVMATGASNDVTKLPPAASLGISVLMLAFLYFLIRLLFLTPLAADGRTPFRRMLPEAWALSRGRWARLFGLILLLALVGLIVLFGLAGALSAVILLVAGPIEPMNLSAVLVALVQQTLGAIVSMFFAVLVARLYVQARDGDRHVSVPDAGHQ
ncbi:hypothetical protein GCM10022281_02770 [Sphingomonas rosea]|uniref:Glycerophosphoryl diester phosphodiesterase membrane domain-containing protein n=1 Tax=Sphingomonas rosea TaxID=335605 RepID=A0ABP7TK90_9SPHN